MGPAFEMFDLASDCALRSYGFACRGRFEAVDFLSSSVEAELSLIFFVLGLDRIDVTPLEEALTPPSVKALVTDVPLFVGVL